jgi:Domain of unknown function (DUF932)
MLSPFSSHPSPGDFTMFALTHDELRSAAPSIFTRSAYHRMSDRYRPAYTADVVDLLEGIGLLPVRAQQSRCRLPDKRDYAKHMIRFRRSEDMDADRSAEIMEVCLCNSFDGSSAYQILLGIHRVICTNGLICPIGDLGGFSVRHKGRDDFNQRIIDTTFTVVNEAPKALETVQAWKQIELSPPQQTAFATAAVELLNNPIIQPAQLLAPRRQEDASSDLWTVFNRTQESILKGGITNRNARGRRVTTRPVKSIDKDVRLNKALWTLAEEMSRLV